MANQLGRASKVIRNARFGFAAGVGFEAVAPPRRKLVDLDLGYALSSGLAS
jgi:hypothetical protein